MMGTGCRGVSGFPINLNGSLFAAARIASLSCCRGCAEAIASAISITTINVGGMVSLLSSGHAAK